MSRLTSVMKLAKPTTSVLLASLVLCTIWSGNALAMDGGVFPVKAWPKNWPKELERSRKQAMRWLEGGRRPTKHDLVRRGIDPNTTIYSSAGYDIRFANREQFESAWPHILKLKSAGAPLTLLRGPHRFFAGGGTGIHNASVRIRTRTPIYPTAQKASPSDETSIELVLDGEIVDLNRICLPADTPIIDKRFPGRIEGALNDRVTSKPLAEPMQLQGGRLEIVVDFGDKPRPARYHVCIHSAKGSKLGWCGSASVDANGRYTFENLPPDKWIVWASPTLGPNPNQSEKVTVEVVRGETTTVVLQATKRDAILLRPIPVGRKSLKQSVAEAEVIVVATASHFSQASQSRTGDPPEYRISFRVTRFLKGKLTDKVFTTRLPSDPKTIKETYIGKATVVMLSPEYVARKHEYGGLYHIMFESQVKAILSNDAK